MINKHILISLLLLFFVQHASRVVAQDKVQASDSLSSFDRFNQKAERFFKVFPVPIVTYSTEAGNTFGLAKFNAFHPVKKDTISKPSKLSEVATFSTKGRVNVSVSMDLILKENKYMFLSFFNFKKQPEYMLGIGNDVSIDDVEEVTTNRIKFSTISLIRVKENFYAGFSFDLANYFKVQYDSNSFLVTDNVNGREGGVDAGLGLSAALDSRDNRYNASKGAFVLANVIFYPAFMGSDYQFQKMELDARKYFTPWRKLKHVIAIQGTTTYITGNVPFYGMAMLGVKIKCAAITKAPLGIKYSLMHK